MIRARFMAFAFQMMSAALSLQTMALADRPQQDEPLGRKRFREGRILTEAGRYADAAERFAESQRLDPAPGTMANLAFCYEKLGKTASAWIVYKETARAAREAGRFAWATMAEASAAALEKGATRVVIEVKPQPSVDLWLDEVELPKRLWGESPPVSAGRHELRATAIGRRPWSAPFETDGGPAPTLAVPELDPIAGPAGVAAQGSERPVAGEHLVAPEGRTQRTAAMVMGGAGVAALVVGSVLAVLGTVDYEASAANCGAVVCRPPGDEQRLRAITEKRIAIVALPMGGLAFAGAAILWFAAPPRHSGVRIGPTVGQMEWGLDLQGEW